MTANIIKKIKSVTIWLVIICAILLAVTTAITVATGSSGGIFGFKMYVALSDSMSKTHFSAGDIVISKKVDPTSLSEGDVITFVAQKDGKQTVITHKIREKTLTERGECAFVTYGTTTGTDDDQPVTYGNILGKYTGKIPWLGHIVQFLKSRVGLLLLVFLPLLIMAFSLGINILALYKDMKKE